MPASEAQILANRANALKSTGPKTEEGKHVSRRNALKHGLTGSGAVLPNEDAAEVERMTREIQADLKPSGPLAEALVRRLAVSIVRMDRGVSNETANLSQRIRQAWDEFEAPEGASPAEIERLRAEVAALAMFDSSKGGCLARRYEASAERVFFKSLQELRRLKRESAAADPATQAAELAAQASASLGRLASSFPAAKVAAPMAAKPAPVVAQPVASVLDGVLADLPPLRGGHFGVPISIGRPR